jgi:PAS domain S-box-containing protein
MNDAFREHYKDYLDIVRYGRHFEDMLREVNARRPIPEGLYDPDWLDKRLTYRREPRGTVLRPMVNGEWFRLTEWNTPDGGIMSVFVPAPETSEETQLHNSLMLNMRDIVFCRSEKGVDRVRIVGKGADEFLGISPESDGHSPEYWYGLVHADDRDSYITAERERKKNGTPYAIEYRFRHPRTGVWKWAREVGWNTEDKATGRVYFDSYVVDRSDAKEQEAKGQQLREVLDAATDIVAIFHADGSLRYLNTGARCQLGIERGKDVEGLRLTVFMPASVRHMLLHDAMHQARMNGTWMGELVFRSSEGRNIPCSAVLVAHKNTGGQIDRFSLIARDISDQRASEHQLRLMRDRAEEANRAKSRFLATMSHELRTPLNAIIGFSELMSEEIFGPIGGDRYRDYIHDIINSATHLLGLIGDVLDVSRIEAGKIVIEPEENNVREVAEQMIEMVRTRSAQKNLDIDNLVDADAPLVTADTRALRQSILNLLSNSVKFTPDGGRITVMAVPDHVEGYRISVTDNGRGIPEDQIEKVLEPFSQVEEDIERRQHEGSGLGLSIVRSFMELHGGQISIESEIDKGTSVHLDFPRKA